MRRVLTGLGLLLPLALTACGTTVPLSQRSSGAGSGGFDTSTTGSTPTGGGAGSGTAGGSAIGTSGSATGAGSSTGSPVAGGSTGSASGTGTGALPAPGSSAPLSQGRGVTATSITIGAAVPTGTEALASAMGVSGGTGASASSVLKAVVNDINLHGGVLGRKLNLYLHEFDASTAIANQARTYADICSDFRDDHKAFVVLTDLSPNPGMRSCFAKMGTPLAVLGGFKLLTRAAYAEHGGSYLYGINAITSERLAELFITSLMQRSFTERWNTTSGGPGGVQPTKLGLIHVDSPDQNALYAAYARELKKHGWAFSSTVTYSSDPSAALAATQNAVLKFQTEGITHVFGASAFFLRAAENQNYRPRYAFIPGLGKLGADNSPPAQMRGALTVGWTPTTDVGISEDPGDTPQAGACRAILKKSGFDTQNRTNQATMYAVCDALFSLRMALTAGGQPTVGALRRGFESVGGRFAPSYTFSALVSAAQHNGVNSVRDMLYDSACSCLKYASTRNRT